MAPRIKPKTSRTRALQPRRTAAKRGADPAKKAAEPEVKLRLDDVFDYMLETDPHEVVPHLDETAREIEYRALMRVAKNTRMSDVEPPKIAPKTELETSLANGYLLAGFDAVNRDLAPRTDG